MMIKFSLTLILILLIVWIVNCVPQSIRKNETIQKWNRSRGEATAVDYLIQKYEKEHHQFYEEEIGDGDHLEWPALDGKNLSDYCKKFLQHSTPGRCTNNTTGSKLRRVLYYEKENMSITRNVVIVYCKLQLGRSYSYYITRARESNCAYAVRCTYGAGISKFTIIHKYCDFEESALKRRRIDTVSKKHSETGQPIAKEEYLLEFELEHQELLKSVGDDGNCIEWPHVMLHDNLDSYCYQYLRECAPGRNAKSSTGNWKIEKLHYQTLNTNEDIEVTIVTCVPNNAVNRRYHITRAFETNCVYALLRKNRNPYSPMRIIFKHCDFENLCGQQIISQGHNTLGDKNVIPKIEVKEENIGELKAVKLFPHD